MWDAAVWYIKYVIASWTEIFEDETAFKLQVQSTENSKSSEKGYVNSSHWPLRKSSFFFSFSLFFFHFFIFFSATPQGSKFARDLTRVYHNTYIQYVHVPSVGIPITWSCTVSAIIDRSTVRVYTVQGRMDSSVRLIQSESENSLRNRITSDLRKKNPAGHFSLIHEWFRSEISQSHSISAAIAREPLCFWQKGLRQATQMVPKLSCTKFQLLNPTGRVRRLSLQLSWHY